jgi:TP901 family phage tail tape measure protein
MATNKKIFIEIITKTSGAEKGLDNVGNAADKSGKKAEQASKSFLGLGRTFTAIARGFVIVKSFQLLAKSISETVKVTAEFEMTMDRVAAISGATGKELDKLVKSARELALGTIFTAQQVGELQLAYSKLGFTTEEILNATEATLQLATITGDDLAKAADVAGSAVRGFGLEAEETQRVVDVMAASFTSSALNLEAFQQSMKTVAPIARAANVDLETSTALLAKLADAGLRGTRAATGLKNIISDMTDPTSDLAQSLGFTVNNSEGVIKAFKVASERGIDLSKATELVDERSKAAFITLANGIEDVEKLSEAFGDAEGTAKEMSDIIQDNLIGDFKELQSVVQEVILSEGSGINSMLRSATQAMKSFLRASMEGGDVLEVFDKKMEGLAGTLSEISELDSKAASSRLIEEIRKQQEELSRLQNDKGLAAGIFPKAFEATVKAQSLVVEDLKKRLTALYGEQEKVKTSQDDLGESVESTTNIIKEQALATYDWGLAWMGAGNDFRETLKEIKAAEEQLKRFEQMTQDQTDFEAFLETRNQLIVDNIAQTAFLMSSLNDVFQTASMNRLNSLQQENDAEYQMFLKTQEDKLAVFDINQKHELDSFVGTQQQKADFERQNELERLEVIKKQEEEADKLRKKQLAEENKVAKKAFAVDKANSIAQIGIQTALGIAQINANPAVNADVTQTLRALLTGLVAATGAAQIAAVGAQKFTPKTFEEGGSIVGPSHSEGGVPFTVSGQAGFEAEGGEYIFSRRTVDRLGTGLLDAINFGGASPRLFADGGVVSASSVSQNAFGGMEMAEMIGSIIAQTVTEIPVVNVATDTLNTGRAVQSAQDMASF